MTAGRGWIRLGERGVWVDVDKIESVSPTRDGASRVRMDSSFTHLDSRKPEEVLEAVRAVYESLAEAEATRDELEDQLIAAAAQPMPAPPRDEPFISPVRIDATKGPHSRACGLSRHVHGLGCSKSCPTCHGKTPAQRLYEIEHAAAKAALDDAEQGTKSAIEIIEQLRGEQGTSVHPARHLHAVPQPEPGKEHRTGGLQLSDHLFGDPAPRSKDVLPVRDPEADR
ncbi:hypothetical protein HOT31_gp038 [Microbacterium phage Hendrix]|uniref:Uncharacterized protein n=1 Tax=Microbacterium phage Hendrix TaxID=2182341 RepID=A0A2U8UUB2_9CAUD|nr:hypothetical protein HOT31_gp038 [Microbacterium phage Hendrix]AWN07709.1 hypothetical protein PBI_HENDRIX_38 [Microbacterium phage Hendrix]